MALTHITQPESWHVNDRSLYIVDRDRQMVVVEGECPTSCKKGEEIIQGKMSGSHKKIFDF